MVTYEGGPGPGGSPLGGSTGTSELCYTYNLDPRMKDRMLIAQDIFNANGGDEFNYYLYSGPAPWSFSNGLNPKSVSDTNSVKLNAIDEITARAPAAATLGTMVPAIIYLKDAVSNVIGADGAGWKLNNTVFRLSSSTAGYVLVPVRTSSTAATATAATAANSTTNYQLSLNVPASSGAAAANVYIEGELVGSINVTDNTSNLSVQTISIPVTLKSGLSVIRIVATKGEIFIKDLILK
jgi:hypothetical protein